METLILAFSSPQYYRAAGSSALLDTDRHHEAHIKLLLYQHALHSCNLCPQAFIGAVYRTTLIEYSAPSDWDPSADPGFPSEHDSLLYDTRGMMSMVHEQQRSTRHTSRAMEETVNASRVNSDVVGVEDAPATQQAAVRQVRKQAYLALTGSALLQLPTWGFAMTFGVFQEYLARTNNPQGSASSSGVIGNVQNGVMYLMMPILFTLLDRGRWSVFRRSAAVAGVLISTLAFLLSSFSTQLWHLIILQGVFAALGNTMLYSPTTLDLDEHFKAGRATAYGAILSSKNTVGTACPLIFSALLDSIGFRWTLRIWSLVVLIIGLIGIGVMPRQSSTSAVSTLELSQTQILLHLQHRQRNLQCRLRHPANLPLILRTRYTTSEHNLFGSDDNTVQYPWHNILRWLRTSE
ncbi:hypothetical protein AC579_4748 [Pseudocercospora musae]|uniref:Major facilitator superfamily (MFS) profile domain-containing protein n=1 Tax=Pseudocercospora musae TaxID=113226 RepID=A0A139IPZ9_9PEZI|nr:hypothetical protein AC579_4748 [Pseudocercospora musae]